MVRVRIGDRLSVSEREASLQREASRREGQRKRRRQGVGNQYFQVIAVFSGNQTGVLYCQNINYKPFKFSKSKSLPRSKKLK